MPYNGIPKYDVLKDKSNKSKQDHLYIENYKTFTREIKEDRNREVCYVHVSEDSMLLRCQFFPN